MAVATYTEYRAREKALYDEAHARYEAAHTKHVECYHDAQVKFDQAMDALNNLQPSTTEEAQAVEDLKVAAAKVFAEEKDKCDTDEANEIAAASLAFQTGLKNLKEEAAASLARVDRLIITLDQLLPAAIALQDLSWYDNHTAAAKAPILTVSSLDDLRHMFEPDRGMFELLLMVRVEDGELAFGADRRKISDILSDVESTTGVKLRVLETVHVRGEVAGAPPTDTDSLSILGTTDIQAIFVPAVAVEIQVSNTPSADDDVVPVKCAHPPARTVMNCQIRLTTESPDPVTVVLHDPNDHIRFPNATDTTATVTLPENRNFVPFQISVEAPGEAVIEASVGSAAGPLCGTQRVTVASFISAAIIVTRGDSYRFIGDFYGVPFPGAVSFSSSAIIDPNDPSGVLCSAPEIAPLRVGIMQETTNKMTTRTWDTPTIAWDPAARLGDQTTVAESVSFMRTYDPSVAQPINDGFAGASPLYDMAPAALTRPLGCPSGAAAVSSDTPGGEMTPTFSQPAFLPSGAPAGRVTWTQRHMTFRQHFRTFCVIFNTSTSKFCALRQVEWELTLDSNPGGNHHATVTPTDQLATANPAPGPVQANSVAQIWSPAIHVGTRTIKYPDTS